MSAREVAERVLDPELPVLTLADLGVLRGVEEAADGRVVVTITPTYSGCPALDEMKADLRRKLTEAGYGQVEVRTALSPAWTTDWISEAGRRKLTEHGIAPPQRKVGPVPLTLASPPRNAPPTRNALPHHPPPSAVNDAFATLTTAKASFTATEPPELSGVAGSVETGGRRPSPPLNLTPPSQRVPCPRCGSANTTELSRFSSTACKALRRCEACREPFEHIKEI